MSRTGYALVVVVDVEPPTDQSVRSGGSEPALRGLVCGGYKTVRTRARPLPRMPLVKCARAKIDWQGRLLNGVPNGNIQLVLAHYTFLRSEGQYPINNETWDEITQSTP